MTTDEMHTLTTGGLRRLHAALGLGTCKSNNKPGLRKRLGADPGLGGIALADVDGSAAKGAAPKRARKAEEPKNGDAKTKSKRKGRGVNEAVRAFFLGNGNKATPVRDVIAAVAKQIGKPEDKIQASVRSATRGVFADYWERPERGTYCLSDKGKAWARELAAE